MGLRRLLRHPDVGHLRQRLLDEVLLRLLGVDRPRRHRLDAVRRHPVGVVRDLVRHLHVVGVDRRYPDRLRPVGVGRDLVRHHRVVGVVRQFRLRRACPAEQRMASCPDVDRLDVGHRLRRPVGVVHGCRLRGFHGVRRRLSAFPAVRRMGCCPDVGCLLA